MHFDLKNVKLVDSIKNEFSSSSSSYCSLDGEELAN